jgi:hypothetical protein
LTEVNEQCKKKENGKNIVAMTTSSKVAIYWVIHYIRALWVSNDRELLYLIDKNAPKKSYSRNACLMCILSLRYFRFIFLKSA